VKISIVIPTYNCVVFLPHAVTTALAQTYKDTEVLVVDDGSTDRTGEYLDWLEKNHPVKVIRCEKNIGRSAARNLGNKEAQGEILCVLDADDIATPNRVELMAKKFKNSQADYVYGAATVIDALGNPHRVLGADTFDLAKSLETGANLIVHSASAYKRSYAEKFPYRNELSKLGLDDWGFQIEGAVAGAVFDFVPQRLCCYRLLTTQVSRIRDKDEVKRVKEAFISTLKTAVAA
jgi:glycosyltransferase involved in cell wall biosynthesis